MGGWSESDLEIHEGGILAIDTNDANAQEEHIPQPMEDEVPQDHSQADTGGMLEAYLDQQCSEEPWKPGQNR